jgi:type I site-specific restriction-modification system R (restriction) subunit
MTLSETQIEAMLIKELCSLKYVHRDDIGDRAALEKNFREHFQALNRVNLTDAEFQRLLEEIVTPVVQIELKTLGINPRRAIEQIVEYKNDAGNGFTRTLLCFIQLFVAIVELAMETEIEAYRWVKYIYIDDPIIFAGRKQRYCCRQSPGANAGAVCQKRASGRVHAPCAVLQRLVQ